jgi:hypothetical protein
MSGKGHCALAMEPVADRISPTAIRTNLEGSKGGFSCAFAVRRAQPRAVAPDWMLRHAP